MVLSNGLPLTAWRKLVPTSASCQGFAAAVFAAPHWQSGAAKSVASVPIRAMFQPNYFQDVMTAATTSYFRLHPS